MKKLLLNISLFSLSIVIGIFVLEGILRIFFNPIDYLKPDIISHPALGHKIKSNSANHDSWGFRNKDVPDHADIITIGDSQTYGDGAPINGSWPYLLNEKTGKKVYNLALGGYGPPQYLYLLQEKSLQLNPSQIIIGLYCGNDFSNSYEMVYGYDYWKGYFNPSGDFNAPSYLTTEIIEANDPNFLGSIGNWLVKRSILYRKTSDTIYQAKMRMNKRLYSDPRFTFFEDSEHDVRTGFKSQVRFSQINFNDPATVEGYRITIEMLTEMHEICETSDIKLSIVLIPTKELVFWDLINKSDNDAKYADIRNSVESELKWRELLAQDLPEIGIQYIDPLDIMKEAVGKTKIYHENLNDHPNKAGYEIIAEVVANMIEP